MMQQSLQVTKKSFPSSTPQICATFNNIVGNLATRCGLVSPDGCARFLSRRFLRHGTEFWPLNTLRSQPNWLQLLPRNSRCALFEGFGADLARPCLGPNCSVAAILWEGGLREMRFATNRKAYNSDKRL